MAFVDRVLGSEATVRAACGPRPVIAHAELTSTGMAIVFVSPRGQPPSVVFKVPMTARAADGMVRESRTLEALHADERLGEWRRLLPVARAAGTLDGRPYRVHAAVRGRTVVRRLRDKASRDSALTSAAETIYALHVASARPTTVDERLAERWVDAPANELLARGAARGLESNLRAVRDELHDAVAGRTFSAGWIHGDYWLGNVLYAADEPRPVGILDWDAAEAPALPVIDVLHLLLYTRRLIAHRDLGEVICETMHGGAWSKEERGLLERYAHWCHQGAMTERDLLLLCWLRHAAHHAGQQDDRQSPGYSRWQSRNVRPILAAL